MPVSQRGAPGKEPSESQKTLNWWPSVLRTSRVLWERVCPW